MESTISGKTMTVKEFCFEYGIGINKGYVCIILNSIINFNNIERYN